MGELQFDVLKYRLMAEYGADVSLDRIPSYGVRWIVGPAQDVEKFVDENGIDCMRDKEERFVCLFPNEYRLSLAEKNFPSLKFQETSLS